MRAGLRHWPFVTPVTFPERSWNALGTPRLDDGRMPDLMTLWAVAVLPVGGVLYLVMSRISTTSPGSSPQAVRRSGWIARRHARNGIAHPRGRVGVGYRSAVGAVHLSVRELAGHGLTFGGPGSGKNMCF
jgi:hypothetical protein